MCLKTSKVTVTQNGTTSVCVWAKMIQIGRIQTIGRFCVVEDAVTLLLLIVAVGFRDAWYK